MKVERRQQEEEYEVLRKEEESRQQERKEYERTPEFKYQQIQEQQNKQNQRSQETNDFQEARKVFEKLHPDTRFEIVSKNKLMYSVMSSQKPPVCNSDVFGGERSLSFSAFLKFKEIYEPKFLEIKTKEDFINQTKDFQEHFKEYFPGEFFVINFNK